MVRTLFPIVLLLSSLAHAEKKVFLVETETNNSVKDTMRQDRMGEDNMGKNRTVEDRKGEDYRTNIFHANSRHNYFLMTDCELECKRGTCEYALMLVVVIHCIEEEETETPSILANAAPHSEGVNEKRFPLRSQCELDCRKGSCQQLLSSEVQYTGLFTCIATPTVTPTTLTTAVTITELPKDSCLRMPRNNIDMKRIIKRKRKKIKRKANPWGHFVNTVGRRRIFCCSRGPKKGEVVRAQRCCKPRSPRSSC